MNWDKVSENEYHDVLRKYRAYLSVIVEDNAKSEDRIYPLTFDEYAEKHLNE